MGLFDSFTNLAKVVGSAISNAGQKTKASVKNNSQSKKPVNPQLPSSSPIDLIHGTAPIIKNQPSGALGDISISRFKRPDPEPFRFKGVNKTGFPSIFNDQQKRAEDNLREEKTQKAYEDAIKSYTDDGYRHVMTNMNDTSRIFMRYDPKDVKPDNVYDVVATQDRFLYDRNGKVRPHAQSWINKGAQAIKPFIIKDFGDYLFNGAEFSDSYTPLGINYNDGFTYTGYDGKKHNAYIGTLKNAVDPDYNGTATHDWSKYVINFMSDKEQTDYLYILGRFGSEKAEEYAVRSGIADRVIKDMENDIARHAGYYSAQQHPVEHYLERPIWGFLKAAEGFWNFGGNIGHGLYTGNFNNPDPAAPTGTFYAAFSEGMNAKEMERLPGWLHPVNSGGTMILDNLVFTALGTYFAGAGAGGASAGSGSGAGSGASLGISGGVVTDGVGKSATVVGNLGSGASAGEFASGISAAGNIAKGFLKNYKFDPSQITTGLGMFGQSFDDNYYAQILNGTADKPGAMLSATVKSGLQALSFSCISNLNAKLFGKIGKSATGLKRFLVNIAEASCNGAGINAAQSFLGQVADTVIRGPYSDFELAKRAYLDQGLSSNAAFWRSLYDTALKPTLESAVAGGLVSAFNAFPQSVSEVMSFSDYGKAVKARGYDYISDGLSLDPNTSAYKFAEKLKLRIADGHEVTNNEAGVASWLNELAHAQRGEFVSTIEALTGSEIKLTFTSDPDAFSGELTPDNEMIVEPNAEHGFDNTVKHETSHFVERFAPEEYTVYSDLLQGVEGYDAAIERISDNYYRVTGKKSTPKAAAAELAADYSMSFGKPLYDRISRLVEKSPAAADRAYSALAWLDSHLRGGQTLVDEATGLRITKKQAYDLQKAYEKAFVAAVEKVRAGDVADGESAYSIRRNSKGKYVQADRQVISGDDPSKWEGQIYDYINDQIRHGEDILIPTEDGDLLTFSEKTAWKMGYRNKVNDNGTIRPYTDSEYKTKLDAASHIDELAIISKRGYKNNPDTKNHSFAEDGFNYRTAFFRDFDNRYYKLTISVGENSEGKTVYNIGKIRRASFPDRGSKASSNDTARGERNSLTDIISDVDPLVNNEFHSVRTARPYGLNASDEVRAYTSDKATDKEFRQFLRITVSDLVQNGFLALDHGDTAEGRRFLHEGGQIIEQHMRRNSAGIADDFTETMINTFNGKKQNFIREGRDIEGINDINHFGTSIPSLMLGIELQRNLAPDADLDRAKEHIRNAFTMANDGSERADIHNELLQAANIITSAERGAYADAAARNAASNQLALDLYNVYRDAQRAGTETDPDVIAADLKKYYRDIEGSFRDLRDAGNLKEGEVRGLSELARTSIDSLFFDANNPDSVIGTIDSKLTDILYGHGHSTLEYLCITNSILNNVLEVTTGLYARKKAEVSDIIKNEELKGNKDSQIALQAQALLDDLERRSTDLLRFNDSLNLRGELKYSKSFLNTLQNPFNSWNHQEMFIRNDQFQYQNRSNRSIYQKAQREILENGIERSLIELMNKPYWDESDNPKAFILESILGRLGMHREAVDLEVVESKRNRAAGRLVQANMIAKNMTPEGKVIEFDKLYNESLVSQFIYKYGQKGKYSKAVKKFTENLDVARTIDNDRRAAADEMLTQNFSEHREAKENIADMRSETLQNSSDLADVISEMNDAKSRADQLRKQVNKSFKKLRAFLFSVKEKGPDNKNVYPIYEEFNNLYNRVVQITHDMNRDIPAELADSTETRREEIINNLKANYGLEDGFDYSRLYDRLDTLRHDMFRSFLDSHDVSNISFDELMNYGRLNVLLKNIRANESALTENAPAPASQFKNALRRAGERANMRDNLIKALKEAGYMGDEIREMWNEHGELEPEWVNYEILRARLRRMGYTNSDIAELEAQNGGELTPELVDPLLYPDTPRFDPEADQSSTLPDLEPEEVQLALDELEGIYKRAAELDEERIQLEDRSGELAAMLNTANAEMAHVIEAAMLRIQEGAKAEDIEYGELANADLYGLNYAVDAYLRKMKIGYIPEAEREKMKRWIFKIAGCDTVGKLINNIIDLSEYRHTATLNKRGLFKKLRRIYQDFEVKPGDERSDAKLDILKDIAFQQIVGSMADMTQTTKAKKARSLHFAVQLLGIPTFLRNIGSEAIMGLPETAVNDIAAFFDSGYALGKAIFDTHKSYRAAVGLAKAEGRTVDDINTDAFNTKESFKKAFKANRKFGFELPFIGAKDRIKAANRRARESFIETALNVNLIGRDRTRFGKDIAYKRSFTKGPGASLERALGYSLSVTDEWLKGYYIEQVRNSLKNTGLTDAEIEAEAKAAADYRVFQNDTLVGLTLERIRKAANTIGFGPRNKDGIKEFGLGDFITTYTFVPGAVATRSFEYSPLGYAKALYLTFRMLHNAYGAAKADYGLRSAAGKTVHFSEKIRGTLSHISRTDARQTMLAFLRPVTGQGMIATGAWLRSKGIIIGTSQTSGYNEDQYEKSKNLGDFRINISQLLRLINGEADGDAAHNDDLLADMGWIVPVNTTLSIGADMYDRVGSTGFKIFAPGNTWNMIESSSNIVSESLEDLAMWSSVNSIFKNQKNTDSVPEFLAAEGADMLFSFMPSVIRQLGTALDPYERDPYKASSVSALFWNKVQSNLPFLRENVPMAIDVFGQVRQRTLGDRAADLFNIGVSPSRLYRYKENALTDELDRLAKQDASDFPTTPYRHQQFELGGQEYKFDLDGENYEKYASMQGMLWYKVLHAFMDDPDYALLSDSMKLSVLHDIKSDVVYNAAREIWVGYQTGMGENELKRIENEVIKKYSTAATDKIRNLQASDYLLQEGVNVEDVIDVGYYADYSDSERNEMVGTYRSYISAINNGTFYDKALGGKSRNWSSSDRADKIADYEHKISDIESGAKRKWIKITGSFAGLSDTDKKTVLSKMQKEPGLIHLPDDLKNHKPDFSNSGPAVIDVSEPVVDFQPKSTIIGHDPTKWSTQRYDERVRFDNELKAAREGAVGSESGKTEDADKDTAGSYNSSYIGFYSYKPRRYRRRSYRRRSYGGGRKRGNKLPYINSSYLGSGSLQTGAGSGGLSRFKSRFGGGRSRFPGASAFSGSSGRKVGYINVH